MLDFMNIAGLPDSVWLLCSYLIQYAHHDQINDFSILDNNIVIC